MMAGKILFAVFIAAFLAQENDAIDLHFVATYESYHKLIDTFLDQVLKIDDDFDITFSNALQSAEIHLTHIEQVIPDKQVKIFNNSYIHEKSSMLSTRKLLHYLKNTTADFIAGLESGMPLVIQDLESEIKNKVEDAGGNLDKLEDCSQKYKYEFNKTVDWLLAGQAGCIMDQVGDGVSIVEKALNVADKITIILSAISQINNPSDIDTKMTQLKQLYDNFPDIEAYAFIESESDQVQQVGDCIALKISQFFVTSMSTVDKIVECTKAT